MVVAPSKEGAAWTQAHQRWLHTQSQQLTPSGLRVAFDEADGAVLAVQARRDRLDAAIVELAMTPPWALLVGRLGCLRGIGVLTGFGLAVEIGDWQRFTGATIGADLGLVPTEQSSGTQRVQGSITKTGNRATVASISAGPAWTPAANVGRKYSRR